MKPVKTKFERNGYVFEQIKRVGDVAIYSQKRPGQVSDGHYEVVRIRRRSARKAFGVQFEAGEYYPSAEEWGVFGWTYGDLVGAEGRVVMLSVAKPKNRATPQD